MQAMPIAPMTDGRSDAEFSNMSRADEATNRYAGGEGPALVDLHDALAPRLQGFALRWTRSGSAATEEGVHT